MKSVMTKKYESQIIEIGEEVELFAEESMLIIFNDTVPEALRMIGVIHKKSDLLGEVEVGDVLEISGESYNILFVGNKVNETLKDIGHCTIVFNGEKTAELPGTMCVEKKPMPTLTVNSEIRIAKY